MAGVKQPELAPGLAPPVVICQKTLMVSVMTEKFSKEIEKVLESRSANLKALEKNPADGYRLNVCKNNTKRQGSSVSLCILSLIQFVREILVGPTASLEQHAGQAGSKKHKATDSSSQIPNDTTSQRSSVAGASESNYAGHPERPDTRAASGALRQQELRQKEIITIVDTALRILKTQRWREVKAVDRSVVLGLFAVIGGWYGFTRIGTGAQVQVQVNGCWSTATVIDEGVGRKQTTVILNDDATLSLVKVPHSQVLPHHSSIDRSINDQLNFDDLCEAISYLHSQ